MLEELLSSALLIPGLMNISAHLYAGNFIARQYKTKQKEKAYVTLLADAPDMDYILGFDFHRTFTHSIPGMGLLAGAASLAPAIYHKIRNWKEVKLNEEINQQKDKYMMYLMALGTHSYIDFLSGHIELFPRLTAGNPLILPDTDPNAGLSHWLAIIPMLTYDIYKKIRK